MARKPRVEFEGAFYHVIVRGNQRRRIFRDDQDRRVYLERLEYYRRHHGFVVYAYVLMSNHVHLLLETKRVPLSKIMQAIQFTYTQKYNRRHRTVGHLFQGRYKAILCDRNAYLLELVRYIHLNPGRMRNAVDAGKFRWSSHRAYLGEKTAVKVETEAVLGQMDKGVAQARRAYVKFIDEGVGGGHQEKYYEATDQRFLGDERFVEKVASRAKVKDIETKGPKVGYERLLDAVSREYGLTRAALTGSGRQRPWIEGRRFLVYLAREWEKMTTEELGKRLERDPSMISRLYRDYAGNRELARERRVAVALTPSWDDPQT
jgi:REP element-mobilizing transposase RayT